MKPGLRAAQRGLGVGLITFVAYLVIVIFTTLSLRPLEAITIALTINWWVISGVSIGTGAQAFLVTYAKDMTCPVAHSRIVLGTSGISSTLASFLSFLSLIPLGCCGTWLYILSFLPGIVGTGISGFLIVHSLQVQAASLTLIVGSVLFTYFSVRRRLISSARLGIEPSSSR